MDRIAVPLRQASVKFGDTLVAGAIAESSSRRVFRETVAKIGEAITVRVTRSDFNESDVRILSTLVRQNGANSRTKLK